MWLLLACARTEAPVPTPAQDSGPADTAGLDTARPQDTAPADTGSDDGEGLRGTALDPALDLPVFAVLDQDGQQRTDADLVGHPTVLWFFREAEGST